MRSLRALTTMQTVPQQDVFFKTSDESSLVFKSHCDINWVLLWGSFWQAVDDCTFQFPFLFWPVHMTPFRSVSFLLRRFHGIIFAARSWHLFEMKMPIFGSFFFPPKRGLIIAVGSTCTCMQQCEGCCYQFECSWMPVHAFCQLQTPPFFQRQ